MNVLIDLDGTLTDPRPGFVASINHALIQLGHAPQAEDWIASHIGPPLEETLTALLTPAHAAQLPAAVSLYRERYAATGIFENSVYRGIPEALRSLQVRGHRLFLATSKPRVFAVRILEHFSLAPYFSGIYGSELDGTRSDKRALLAYLIDQERIHIGTAVMIGDRAQDIRAARTHRLPSIGVLWGYGSLDELEKAGATQIVSEPEALPAAVASAHGQSDTAP